MRTDKNWIQTYTGRQFWPLDPRPEDVCIEDIAHALALKCRFTGHCRVFYSVAQHSVMASEIVPRHAALQALMHDAAEAYLCDLAKPLKAELQNMVDAEARIMEAIAARFGFEHRMLPEVHEADARMLVTERRDLMGTPPRPWTHAPGMEPLPRSIRAWEPDVAEALFLARFHSLTDPDQGTRFPVAA